MSTFRSLLPNDSLTRSLLVGVLAAMIQHSLEKDAAASVKDANQPGTAASDACLQEAGTREHDTNLSKNQSPTEAAFGKSVRPT